MGFRLVEGRMREGVLRISEFQNFRISEMLYTFGEKDRLRAKIEVGAELAF